MYLIGQMRIQEEITTEATEFIVVSSILSYVTEKVATEVK